jgi:hypothetical protein
VHSKPPIVGIGHGAFFDSDGKQIPLSLGFVDQAFPFPAGTQMPIGVPSVPGGKYQAGGKEIEFGPGGVCTDCHAGENPYIVHPLANLATSGPPVLWQSLAGAPQNLPMKPVNRYDPLVGSTWPQNKFSPDASSVSGACGGCHVKASKGRLPQLSNEISQHCCLVLAQAIMKTMPPGAGGTAAAAGNAFKNAWCGMAPVAGSFLSLIQSVVRSKSFAENAITTPFAVDLRSINP